MSQERCEQLVEQYMAGEMTHAEEEAFFIQVAVDDDLRRTLKAYRIIDSSIRKEREASAHGHHAVRDRVAAAFLAASSERIASAAGSPAAPTTAQAGSNDPRSLRRLLIGLAVIATFLVLAIEQPWRQNVAPAAQPDSSSTLRLAPEVPSAASWNDTLRGTVQVTSPASQRTAATPPPEPAATLPAAASTAALRRSTTPRSKPSAIEAADTSAAVTATGSSDTPLVAPIDSIPRSITNQDTMRLPVRIDWEIR